MHSPDIICDDNKTRRPQSHKLTQLRWNGRRTEELRRPDGMLEDTTRWFAVKKGFEFLGRCFTAIYTDGEAKENTSASKGSRQS